MAILTHTYGGSGSDKNALSSWCKRSNTLTYFC